MHIQNTKKLILQTIHLPNTKTYQIQIHIKYKDKQIQITHIFDTATKKWWSMRLHESLKNGKAS